MVRGVAYDGFSKTVQKSPAMLAYPRPRPVHPMPRWKILFRSLPFAISLSFLAISFLPIVSVAQQTGEVPQAIDGPLAAPKAPAMNNGSVMKMAKAGLGDDLIIQTINTQPGQYTTDADALVALKTAGVSDRVITAMINKSRRQLTNVPEKPIEISDVNEIGVYYKDHSGKWTAIEPEIVHIKSGGFIKSTVTHGIVKEDRNGHLNGRESKLALQCPIDILIYLPEGVSANEYDFLRFRIHSDNREFRVLTGGVFHSTGGADRDEVKFAPVKTGPHIYQFTVDKDTGGGEYGILPPGTGNVTNGGKIYTFAIVE
jgi:hypothetical protein